MGIKNNQLEQRSEESSDRSKLIAEAWRVFEAAGRVPQGSMDHETQWLPFAQLYNMVERLIEELEKD